MRPIRSASTRSDDCLTLPGIRPPRHFGAAQREAKATDSKPTRPNSRQVAANLRATETCKNTDSFPFTLPSSISSALPVQPDRNLSSQMENRSVIMVDRVNNTNYSAQVKLNLAG